MYDIPLERKQGSMSIKDVYVYGQSTLILVCKDKVSLDKWANILNLQQHQPLNKIKVVATSNESCLINKKTTPNYWILCQAHF